MTEASDPLPAKRRRKWRRWVAVGVVLFLLGPYLYSRVASGHNAIRSRELSDVDAPRVLAQTDRVRVLAYNIAHGRGLSESNWAAGDRPARLAEIAALLREVNADVVVLNEVDFRSAWSGHENQAAALARAAGYRFWVEQRNLDLQVGWWSIKSGNAVLSKHPLRDPQLIDYPGYAGWESLAAGKKRGLVCTVEFPSGPVRLIAVHLSHRSESVRVKSAQILRDLSTSGGVPLVLAGDFNSAPAGFAGHARTTSGENAVELLLADGGFHASASETGPATFPANAPGQTIDWILHPRTWRVIDHRVIDTQLSDHRPVAADFELSAATAGDTP
jgi:endonuclease/exonuclease/phosphatase family metal-dependent hydrolase